MIQNLWTEHASVLAEAYIRSAGSVQFEIVTRSLLMHMPSEPQRVVDVGGGFGKQAILLARAGHFVVVVDVDPNMLDITRNQLLTEPHEVSSRVELVLGDGVNAVNLVGTDFDLACCHSVLMYQDDPVPMLVSLVNLVRHSGLISVVSLNTQAIAMRSGLQGRWQEAKASLETGIQSGSQYLPIREYSREEITKILETVGAKTIGWYGVGVFTDHLTEKIFVEDPEEVYKVEWLAGNRDPYRQVARCFHLLSERS